MTPDGGPIESAVYSVEAAERAALTENQVQRQRSHGVSSGFRLVARKQYDVPFVTAAQASALLKSGMAISNELIGAAFPELSKTILDELSGKWDFDVGSPLVQRHLAAKLDDLHHTFMARLKETQDQYFHRNYGRPGAGGHGFTRR